MAEAEIKGATEVGLHVDDTGTVRLADLVEASGELIEFGHEGDGAMPTVGPIDQIDVQVEFGDLTVEDVLADNGDVATLNGSAAGENGAMLSEKHPVVVEADVDALGGRVGLVAEVLFGNDQQES